MSEVNYLLTSSLHTLHTNFGAASTLTLVCGVVCRGICSGTVQKWKILHQIVNLKSLSVIFLILHKVK